MKRPWSAHCESTELAVELSRSAQAVGLEVQPEVNDADGVDGSRPSLWLCWTAPAAEDLSTWAAAAQRAENQAVLCVAAVQSGPIHALAASLGLVATWDVEAAVVAAALLEGGGERAHRASTRGLPEAMQARLPRRVGGSDARAGKLELEETGQLRWVPRGGRGQRDGGVALGPPAIARQVLSALAEREAASWKGGQRPKPNPERERSAEVLFGPERRLSDPASKAALRPYGIPTPHEELCTSPSRAASEAARMDFPVRITLASPDLRAWDEPDLRVDGVDNAARVRDVYRQLTALAAERNPNARVLGVTVAQTRLAGALLDVRAIPVDDGFTRVQLGFADPHGAAARDETWLAVPCDAAGLAASLGRLRGRSLLLGSGTSQRTEVCERLATLLDQLHAFAADFPAEVREVRLHPVAVLLSGDLEVREAAVSVSDAYERDL